MFAAAAQRFTEVMSMTTVRGLSLIAAMVSVGFVGAIFVHWSNTIMPGLRGTDDRTFVTAAQSLDFAILNPLFLGFGVTGGMILTAVAGVLQFTGGAREAVPWIAAALVLFLIGIMITGAIHLPLNEVLESAGDPADIADPSALRERFNESRWTLWNHVRAATSVLSLGCLTWALVVFARTTG